MQRLVFQVTDAVQGAYAHLTADLKNMGHGLGAKAHVADRWIAATAIANGLPLASTDGIYADVPGLTLLAP